MALPSIISFFSITDLLTETGLVQEFPEVNYNFIVLLGLDLLGEFSSVENLAADIPVLEYKEGGRNFAPYQLPYDGPRKPGQLTLRWGTPLWATLFDWMQEVQIGHAFRRNVYIIRLGRNGWPSRIIALDGAYPVSWKGANLDTSNTSWALEEVTLAYDKIDQYLTRFIAS